MTDETTPPPATAAIDEQSATERVADVTEERHRRRKLRVTVATLITAGLATGAAAYAVVDSRGAAQDVAATSSVTRSPSTRTPNPSLHGGSAIPQLPRRQTPASPPGGSLTDSTQTSAATARQQVGVVDINTVLNDGSQAAGTGMVLTSNGVILTNNHVIKDSTRIEAVVVSTGQRYVASVVGTDAHHDIAVLKVQGATGLGTVTIDRAAVSVGDNVTGVGNAGGAGGDPSAAAGTVLALHQHITVGSESSPARARLAGLIKINADIIPGDSGGPLYDAQTEVVGIDTAASSGQQNVTGFAIPIASALHIVHTIESGRAVSGVQLGYPAFLGVELSPTTSSNGVLVAGVDGGSAAASARIGAGDTITSLAGRTVHSATQLARRVKSFAPGDSVPVTWTDTAGRTHEATVTLGRGPAS